MNKDFSTMLTSQIENVLLTSTSKVHLPLIYAHETLHTHPHIEIFSCVKGKMTIRTAEGSYHLKSGDLAVIPAEFLHTKQRDDSEDDEWISTGVIIKKCKSESENDLFSRLSPFLKSSRILVFENKPQFADMMNGFNHLTDKAKLEGLNLLFSVQLCELICDSPPSEEGFESDKKKTPKDIERLVKISNHIGDYYMKPISNKEMAEKLFMSERQLSRIVKKYYGVPLHALIISKRIEMAALLLLNSDDSVDEIANAVGFNSKLGFYKEFKETYGLTPLHYRKKHKEANG